MGFAELPGALLFLLAIAFVGRVVLSFLPPGPPGSHDLGQLPSTWATSHLLGVIGLTAQARIFHLLGLPEETWRLAVPWILAGFARWITLPGAMVPRHEPRSEVSGPGARLLGVVAAAIGVFAAFRVVALAVSFSVVSAASVVALLVLSGYGLERARRAPLGRALAVLALSLLLLANPVYAWTGELLAVGSGAAFAIPWLRRADRRAGALSVISYSGAALFGTSGACLGAAGLLGLCLHTAAPSRARISAWSVAALLLFVVFGRELTALVWSVASSSAPAPEGSPWIVDAVVVALALLLTFLRVAPKVQAPASSHPAAEPPGREVAALRDAVLASVVLVLASLVLGALHDKLVPASSAAATLLPLLPAAILLLGLALARAEEPLSST